MMSAVGVVLKPLNLASAALKMGRKEKRSQLWEKQTA